MREHQFSGEDLAYGLDASYNSASGILELEEELKIRDQPMLCVKLRKNATKALVASREEETRHAEKWRAQQDQEAAQERAVLIEERLARARNTPGPASPSVGPFETRSPDRRKQMLATPVKEDGNIKNQTNYEKRKEARREMQICWSFREHGDCTDDINCGKCDL